MRNLLLPFLFCLLAIATLSAQETSKPHDFTKIDAYAHACPRAAERSIEKLAEYLGKGASTDWEKARVIFIWLCDHIRYDDDGYNDRDLGDNSAEEVLKRKKGVCEGFSNLYLALGQTMQLNIVKVTGYSKGYSYQKGKKFSATNHAWNLIEIQGAWRIFDATWGQGYGSRENGNLVAEKAFDPFWFNVDPYAAIFSHLPKQAEYQLLEKPITKATYEWMPAVNSDYFALGFDGKSTYEAVRKDTTLLFPRVFTKKQPILVVTAPQFENLRLKTPVVFEFISEDMEEVAINDARNQWTFFEKTGNQFRLEYTPTVQGELNIMLKEGKKGNEYATILRYNVLR
jgi:hypothetical protein